MKKLIIVLCLLLSINIFSQDISRNTIFAEASGVTGIYSVNYERLLRDNKNINFSLRAGVCYIPEKMYDVTYYSIENSFSLIKNIQNNHFIEMRFSIANVFYATTTYHNNGLGNPSGITLTEEKTNNYDLYPGFGFGYRYQPKTKGIFFNFLIQSKAYFYEENLLKNFSLGLGYAF